MRPKSSPCMGCEKRKPGCHAGCAEYKEYRKALDEYNEMVKTATQTGAQVRDLTIRAKGRITRRLGMIKKRGWTR